jgi:hypothetical protein
MGVVEEKVGEVKLEAWGAWDEFGALGHQKNSASQSRSRGCRQMEGGE